MHRLDAIHHLPGWTPVDRSEMRRVVSECTGASRWVVDGQHGSMVGDIVLGRTDPCVWLDLPRRVVMPRVMWRTLRRGIRREEQWTGNRERPRDWFKPNPRESIVLWSWTQVETDREQYRAEMARPANAHLTWVHITSPQMLETWLASLG